MKLEGIDKGNSFDWGKTSRDYAKYRDIYPVEFCITTRNFWRVVNLCWPWIWFVYDFYVCWLNIRFSFDIDKMRC